MEDDCIDEYTDIIILISPNIDNILITQYDPIEDKDEIIVLKQELVDQFIEKLKNVAYGENDGLV